MLVERGLLDLDRPVSAYWPEFGAHGKGAITVAQVLSHRAGLPFVPAELTTAEVLNDQVVAEHLAAMRPVWVPGAAFGYHALTVGAMASELTARITGATIAEFFDSEVRCPRGLEAWFHTPEEIEPRVAPVVFPEAQADANPTPGLADAVYANLGGSPSRLDIIANTRDGHTAGLAAASAVASARGLAGAYGAALWDDGYGRLFGDDTRRAMTQIRSDGLDITTGSVLRFGALFMLPWRERPFASWQAFGHDGAADALAFADPEVGLAFGYTTDRPWSGQDPRRPDALARLALRIARDSA